MDWEGCIPCEGRILCVDCILRESGESCKQIQALGPRLGRDARTRAGSVGVGSYTGRWDTDLQRFKCEVFKEIACLSSRINF